MAQMPVRFTTTINPQPLRSVRKIKQFQLMVGVPASSAARPSTGGRPDPNNAALLYIHENGSPAAHIPARPSLHPGVNRVRQQIIALLRAGAAAAAAGKGEALLIRNMNTAGLLAVNSVRGVIRAHIPPPLAATTKNAAPYSHGSLPSSIGGKAEGYDGRSLSRHIHAAV